MPRRLLRRCAPLAAVLVLTACASTVGGTGTPPSAPPPPDLPPDQLVLRVEHGLGYSPEDYYLAYVPYLSVYGDGRVYRLEHHDGPLSPTLMLAQADPDEVAALVAQLERAGVIDEDTDFGFPQITDLGSTVVTVHGAKGKKVADPYALSIEEADDDLTGAQAKNRQRLREQIEQIEALTAGEQPRTPDAVEVVEADVDPASVDGVLQVWPGPDPATFVTTPNGSWGLCGAVDGPDAATLYTAAALVPEHVWSVNGEPRRLIVKVLLPGDQPCDG